jgi:hypothetical protein
MQYEMISLVLIREGKSGLQFILHFLNIGYILSAKPARGTISQLRRE